MQIKNDCLKCNAWKKIDELKETIRKRNMLIRDLRASQKHWIETADKCYKMYENELNAE